MYILRPLLPFLTLLTTSHSLTTTTNTSLTHPAATTHNGTYYGIHQSSLHQDFFFGIPYAQPPTGDLRFRTPQSLNTSWTGQRNATELGPMCIGYGTTQDVLGDYMSEDCLTLNVVRPSNVSEEYGPLPVAVWIHGGSFESGAARDPRYNMTAILQQSVQMGKPMMAVTLNYRLSYWGWLFGNEVLEEGVANLGLRDQRLALHWIQENIRAFGGDPSKVTIWGQEAGAFSVGLHLIAYAGRDDGLFRAAISESGNPTLMWSSVTATEYQPLYDAFIASTNCTSAPSTLSCLRTIPTSTLSALFTRNLTSHIHTNPVIDNDIIQSLGSTALRSGHFVHVPYLTGTNFDEGTQQGFGVEGINTAAQFLSMVQSDGLNTTTPQHIAAIYPDDPSLGIPATLPSRPGNNTIATYGAQWKRSAAYNGDKVMHAGRRLASTSWAERGVAVLTYQWNVMMHATWYIFGARHFDEVAFVFYIGMDLGGDDQKPTFAPLSDLMSRMWAGFVTTLDPNNHGLNTSVVWPEYTLDNKRNMVFDVNVTDLAYIEDDDFREDGISYLMDLFSGDLKK
ncbi:carboxylesterase family protein [Aspergillus ellipticus CBS 707.79]|uniref:Carboxylesterase family protein n=1 Tax=Aspergillus ellipticus CBS 707.79 TaxID=1448320 RepID=A0A319D406_9EURO|nr:carboxylesterase family protein [Aspergillus ellipticus CBS 707.79]